jgi:hypothetical protein
VNRLLSLACAIVISASAQESSGPIPRFEDYPVPEVFKGTPAQPVLTTPEERRFRTVIRNGVSKGWGSEDGVTGKELLGPEPNFAGRYAIITWGCGSPCLMAAIVDLKTGRVYPPPYHRPEHNYFQVPWAFPMEPPLEYRLNSRLLIARICEVTAADGAGKNCGAHYFVMSENGPKLVHKILE